MLTCSLMRRWLERGAHSPAERSEGKEGEEGEREERMRTMSYGGLPTHLLSEQLLEGLLLIPGLSQLQLEG